MRPCTPTPQRRSGRRRARRLGIAAAITVCAVVGPGQAAVAHPGGSPPTATVTADGATVTVAWSASPDDAAEIGAHLGLLDADAPDAFLTGGPEALPTAAQRHALTDAPALRRHLLDRVRVEQGDAPCTGDVTVGSDFIDDGATLRFECPRPVERVRVGVRLLHDVDSAYRTFGASPTGRPEVAVFTSSASEHVWDFAAPAVEPSRPSLAALAVGLIAPAPLLGVLVVARRRAVASPRGRGRPAAGAPRGGGGPVAGAARCRGRR